MNGHTHPDGRAEAAPPDPRPRASFDDHPCLSALASCSGLVPCEACRMALGTHVIPKSLHAVAVALESGAEPVAQVTAFLSTYAEAQRALVAGIRQAAVAHEARIVATREAFVIPAPIEAAAPSPVKIAPPKRAASVPPPAQTAPVKKAPRTAAVVAAEAAALDDLFAGAVSPSPSPTIPPSPPKAPKAKAPANGSPSTPASRKEEKTP